MGVGGGGVELDGGPGTLRVELLDPAFVAGGNNNVNAGDHNPGGNHPFPTTRFRLYNADPTPLDLSDNSVLCTFDYAPQPAGTPFDWQTLCATAVPGSGVYPLQVVITDDGWGLNRFSMRSSFTGGSSRIYGLGDMSIYANVKSDGSSPASFYLAEVEEVHQEKVLVIELYDPGDASGSNLIYIKNPQGVSPPCHLKVPNDGIDTMLGSCVIDTTRPANNYDGDWLEIRILLDPYACAGSNCWWTIEYTYLDATDTTTWTARIEGNPVRLVE